MSFSVSNIYPKLGPSLKPLPSRGFTGADRVLGNEDALTISRMKATHTPSIETPFTVSAHQATDQLPRVWSINDIAALYGRSTKWAERLVKQAEFPQPLRGDKHRWWADEVTAFAKSPSKPASSAEILTASPKSQPITRIARSNARQYSQRTKKATQTNTSRKVVAK